MLLALAAAASAGPPKQRVKRAKARPTAKPAAKTAAKEHTDPSRLAMPHDADALPAVRYGALSQTDCEAELDRRKIAFERVTAPGVLAPVRLRGTLHGVEFRSDLPAAQRATSPYEI